MNPPDSFTPERNDPAQPWWRVGMVWLVIGGPLVVVVASLITAAQAVIHTRGSARCMPSAARLPA